MHRVIILIFLFVSCDSDVNNNEDPIELNLSPGSTFNVVGKKGVAFSNRYASTWDTKFELLSPEWHYSWNWELRNNYPEGVEFVPMLWDEKHVTTENINYLKELAENEEIKYLLGFNEPDLESQANMTVDEAIALWPQLESVGVPLGSPVTTSPNKDWMNEFMDKAIENNLRVDFVAIHIYDRSNVDRFINLLNETYEKFQRPIWITEFALRDSGASSSVPNKYSQEDVLAYMQNLLPKIQELEFVHRYAWFDTSTDNQNYDKLSSAELITENNILTNLGSYYATFKSD